MRGVQQPARIMSKSAECSIYVYANRLLYNAFEKVYEGTWNCRSCEGQCKWPITGHKRKGKVWYCVLCCADPFILMLSSQSAVLIETAGHVRDIASGQLLDTIEDVASIEWAGDGKTIFYTVQNEKRRPHQVFRRIIPALCRKAEVHFIDLRRPSLCRQRTCFVFERLMCPLCLKDRVRFFGLREQSYK